MQINTKEILDILTVRFGSIPSSGVIGGQAVAEACFQCLNLPIKTQMKDLDWFVDSRQTNVVGAFRQPSDCYSSKEGEFSRVCVGLSFQDVIQGEVIPKHLYSVIGSDSIGEINMVSIRMREGTGFNVRNIVTGFDLNLVQIGICLESGELYFTPEFERFLEDHTMRTTNYSTPAGTLLRVLKKASQFSGVKFDKEYSIRMLVTAISMRQTLKEGYAYGCGLGESRYKELEPYKDVVAEHFEVERLYYESRSADSRPSFAVYNLIPKNPVTRFDITDFSVRYLLAYTPGITHAGDVATQRELIAAINTLNSFDIEQQNSIDLVIGQHAFHSAMDGETSCGIADIYDLSKINHMLGFDARVHPFDLSKNLVLLFLVRTAIQTGDWSPVVRAQISHNYNDLAEIPPSFEIEGLKCETTRDRDIILKSDSETYPTKHWAYLAKEHGAMISVTDSNKNEDDIGRSYKMFAYYEGCRDSRAQIISNGVHIPASSELVAAYLNRIVCPPTSGDFVDNIPF